MSSMGLTPFRGHRLGGLCRGGEPVLEGYRVDLSEAGVPAASVVDLLDPGADRGDGLGAGGEGMPVVVLGLQRRPEALLLAAQREVWTGAQLRRLLSEKAGLEMSSASVSVLLTKEPAQMKLSTLLALCTALECTPNDLFEIDTTPVDRPARPVASTTVRPAAAVGRGRSMPPL